MAQEVIEITEREIEVIEVVERGPVGQTGPQPNINYEVVTSSRTVSSRQFLAADTTSGAFTLTLPANPADGDAIDILDYAETFDTFPLTIARNGQRIESLEEDLICNVEGAYFTLVYTGSTRGWQILPRYGTSGGGGESILTLEGDTLYRGPLVNERLPIGTAGQILKVNSSATAPEWGAAPATGVTSVAVSGSDGIEVDSGSPITGTGTIALGVNAATLRSHINVADGANNYTHPNHSGEVTSSGDGATTIANDVVTNAKLSNVATSTIKGRATAGTGDPEDLSASQVRTILNVADGAEVNVQSNWTEADSGSDAFILNKPTLGGAAALNVGTTTGTVAAGDDARLSDSRTPTAHKTSHATGGSDALAPSDIGAAAASHSHVLADITDAGTAAGFDADQNLGTGDDVTFNSVTSGAVNCNDITIGIIDGANAIAALGTKIDFENAKIEGFGIDARSDEFRLFNFEDPTKKARFATGAITTETERTYGLPNANGTLALTSDIPDIGTAAGEVAEGDHTHELDELDATGITDGFVLTADGAGGAAFEALPASGVTGAAASASDVLGVSGSDITGVDATADRLVFWDDSASALKYLEAGSGLSISGTTLTATATGTIGGSTSTDNAIVRADSTSNTVQDSALVIDDATTSTQANVALRNNHSETNSALVLTPKGTGAFIVGPKPDGTATGGNACGSNSFSAVLDRSSATQVASGNNSVAIGYRAIASGLRSVAIGSTASAQEAFAAGGASGSASGNGSVCIGGQNGSATTTYAVCIGGYLSTASGANSVSGGEGCTASASYSANLSGIRSLADRYAMQAHAAGRFNANGDAQRARFVLRCKTTTNAAVEMALDGSTTYLTIPSGKVIFCNIKVVGVKSDGSAVATYQRQYAAKNVAGTSSEVYAAVTIGTDNAASTSLAIATVDAGGDYISIKPTGIASETWRWVASVDAVEVAYGT